MSLGHVTVREVMAREYPVVDKDETLEHAVRVMKRYDSDRAVVVEKGRLVGVVTKKDIMMKLATLRTRSTAPGRLHVSSFMTPEPKTVTPDLTVVETAQRMIASNIGSYPVTDGEQTVGLVTRWEIANLTERLTGFRVADVMTTVPEVLRTSNKLLHARQLLLKHNTIFLPVLDEDGRPVGYITIDEVADAFLAFHGIVPEKYRKERIERLVVDDVMRLRPPTVSLEDDIRTLLEKLRAKKSKGAIVVHDDRLVGMVTLVELVKLVATRGS